jgi:hypothetical protein
LHHTDPEQAADDAVDQAALRVGAMPRREVGSRPMAQAIPRVM